MAEWQAKVVDKYTTEEQEPHDNGALMCLTLFENGWVLESACVIVSYAYQLSGLNPWFWSRNDIPTYDEFLGWSTSEVKEHFYGLFQLQCNAYINPLNAARYSEWYAPNFLIERGEPKDGEAQMHDFLEFRLRPWDDSNRDTYYNAFKEIGVDIDTFYNITFDEFIKGATNESKIPLDDLVLAWMLKHEQLSVDDAVSTYVSRVVDASYWLTYYTANPPMPPEPPKKRKKMPLYMMMWWY